jgi:hypothetical protein
MNRPQPQPIWWEGEPTITLVEDDVVVRLYDSRDRFGGGWAVPYTVREGGKLVFKSYVGSGASSTDGKDVLAAVLSFCSVGPGEDDGYSDLQEQFVSEHGERLGNLACEIRERTPSGSFRCEGCHRIFPSLEACRRHFKETDEDVVNVYAHSMFEDDEGEEFDVESDTEDEVPQEPSPEDYVTSDYRRWFSHEGTGRVILETDPENWAAGVREHMDRESFWPNAWFIGERGDVNLLDLSGDGGFAAERREI